MADNENILQLMYLSGTVSIPPRFPDLADISFERVSGSYLVHATQRLSPKVVIKRTFFVKDVTAVFEPSDPEEVDLKNCDDWTTGSDEVQELAVDSAGGDSIQGIIYVREDAQSAMEVQAGLTAAESAEYYPPLPNDRSVNHYNMAPGSDFKVGCPM